MDDILSVVKTVVKNHNILRVKGYISIKHKPMRLLVQAVGTRVRAQFDRLWRLEESRTGRLVFIAEHDDLKKDNIEKLLKVNPSICT